MTVFVWPPFIVGSVQVSGRSLRIHRGPHSASGGSFEYKQKRKGLFVASKSDLSAGSQERTGPGASTEPRAASVETKRKTKFKAVVTATMKRRALKPKKTKAESSR